MHWYKPAIYNLISLRDLTQCPSALSIWRPKNEQDRKSKHGGYVELKASETLAAEKAREAREQYKQALRANKEKLTQAQQNWPSLIQRHDQVLCNVC